MSVKGDSCFPSISTLVTDTGLSRRTVITHLQIAIEDGWLEDGTHGFTGQGWRRKEYRATIPKSLNVVQEMHHVDEPGKVVQEMHHVNGEVVQEMHQGGASDDQNVVQEMHPNIPITSSVSSTERVRARARTREGELSQAERRSYRDTLPEEQTYPMKLYRRYYPDENITSYQKELISKFGDLDALQEALEFWRGNEYKGRSVKTLLDKAEEIRASRSKSAGESSIENFR